MNARHDISMLGGDDPLMVAWVNEGSATTDPWTARLGLARHAVETTFGPAVRTEFHERVDPKQAAELMEQLVRQGHHIIFATSAGLAAATESVADANPGTRFEQARGRVLAPNVATYSGAHEEPAYLAGFLSGLVSSSGRLGFVATVPEPETIRHVNAFALGARRARSDSGVLVKFTHSWWNMDDERGLAEEAIATGVDVLATGCTSPATGHAAVRAGIRWCAHDADRSAELGFRDVWLTAPLVDWRRYCVRRVAELIEGTWRPQAYYGDLADGFTDIAPLGRSVDPETRRMVMAERARLVDHRLDVFEGPLWDNQGTERVASQGSLDARGRETMDWFVSSVEVGSPLP